MGGFGRVGTYQFPQTHKLRHRLWLPMNVAPIVVLPRKPPDSQKDQVGPAAGVLVEEALSRDGMLAERLV